MEFKTYRFVIQLPANQGGQLVTVEQGRTMYEAQKLVEAKYPTAKSVSCLGEQK
jgi:hypothetical protein